MNRIVLEATMNALHKARFLKGFSQYKLAILAGVHQSRISLIENGLTKPTDAEKKKIAKALGVNLQELWNQEKISGKDDEQWSS